MGKLDARSENSESPAAEPMPVDLTEQYDRRASAGSNTSELSGPPFLCNRQQKSSSIAKFITQISREEPLKPWIYLPQLQRQMLRNGFPFEALNFREKMLYNRYVFLDLGARDPGSSVSWFVRNHPMFRVPGKQVTIFAFEADPAYAAKLRAASLSFTPHTMHVVEKAVWTSAGVLTFGGTMGSLQGSENGARSTDDLKGEEKGVTRDVPSIDFTAWLVQNLRVDDYTVIKMDIEGAEFAVLSKLLERPARCFPRELFVEVHYNRYQRTRKGRQTRPHTWQNVLEMLKKLRDAGIVANLWV